MQHITHQLSVPPEKLLTLKQAQQELGIPYYKLLRAANAGLIPTYSLLNNKKYVRASDILKAMGH
jgi:predicted site-specific integrase-resolvase